MDQQGYFCPHRDRAKRRLGRNDAREEDRHLGFEKGRHGRILLPLSSQYEGHPHRRAVTDSSISPARRQRASATLSRPSRDASTKRSPRSTLTPCFVCGSFGAGEGNRTLVCSLGSCRSTIELRPLTYSIKSG